MKKGILKEGDLVVMNDLIDATLYVVLEVDGFNANIREAGTNYRAEWQDVSLMQYPTQEQMGG
jgi:hypothetical protein